MFRELEGNSDGLRVTNLYGFDDALESLKFSSVRILGWIIWIDRVVEEVLLVHRKYGQAESDVFIMANGNARQGWFARADYIDIRGD